MLIGLSLAALSLIVWHVWIYGPSNHLILPKNTSNSFAHSLVIEFNDLLFNKHGIIAQLRELLPYFIIGILIAGYLRTFKVAVKLQASLKKYGVLSVFLASFVGIITPLCACGTLTTAISLMFAGIPLAPVMSLMVASPLLSPSTYLITLSDLGSEWTVIRAISAYAMGVFAGLVTHAISKRPGFQKNDIFIEGAVIRGDFHDDDYPDERLRCNCRRNFGNRVAVKTGNKFLIFLAKSSETLWVVGKYVLVGVVIGQIIEWYMPTEWIYSLFGRKDPLSIVWITLASVPIFLHQLSASSIIAHIKNSLNGTIDGGAALAFMIGGPVTAVPTMVMFWTFFKKRIFMLYMFVCLTGTLLIAYTFQYFVFVPGVDMGNPLLKGVGSLSGGISSTITKKSTNVRMVMDPYGKGIIATYANDVEGQGAIVFDASPSRFSSANGDHPDNRKYHHNIAAWLEQNSNLQVQNRILIYSFSDAKPLNASDIADLANNGYSVKAVNRSESPHLTPSLLADCSQLWLFFDKHSSNVLNDDELKLITQHNSKSGGMLVVAAPLDSEAIFEQPANRVSSRYGVLFSGAVKNSQHMDVSVMANILNHTSEALGAILKMVKKA